MVSAQLRALTVGLSLVAILGDYILKRAGGGDINVGFFIAGTVIYGLCALVSIALLSRFG